MENGKVINLIKSNIKIIAGDASFRKFFRINVNKKNQIIVQSKSEKYKNLVIYAAINDFLRKNKILAPKILKKDFEKGIMIIEDFGDLTFYKILIKTKNKIKVYKKLIELLLKIQKIKSPKKIKIKKNKNYLIKTYSTNLLHQESDLFFEWYLPLFIKKKKIIKIKKLIKKNLDFFYKKINFSNSIFVHRDYHVSNLMKVNDKIGVIDSQDAVIGNPTYDLVSLVDDVRIKTTEKLKQEIIQYYIKKGPKIYQNNLNKFLEDFDTLSVQRNLKIIGIFSRLFIRDKKIKYLKFIPYTWKLLELRLKNPKFSKLRKILNDSVSKKIRKKTFFDENY